MYSGIRAPAGTACVHLRIPACIYTWPNTRIYVCIHIPLFVRRLAARICSEYPEEATWYHQSSPTTQPETSLPLRGVQIFGAQIIGEQVHGEQVICALAICYVS